MVLIYKSCIILVHLSHIVGSYILISYSSAEYKRLYYKLEHDIHIWKRRKGNSQLAITTSQVELNINSQDGNFVTFSYTCLLSTCNYRDVDMNCTGIIGFTQNHVEYLHHHLYIMMQAFTSLCISISHHRRKLAGASSHTSLHASFCVSVYKCL